MYFLEGRCDGVVGTVRARTESAPNASAEPILLGYVALLRLGHPQEAEALLRTQSERFVGPASQHGLLMRAQRRVPDLAWDGLSAEAIRHMTFFDALAQIAAGDVRAARQALTEAARDASGIYALAIRIELERLD